MEKDSQKALIGYIFPSSDYAQEWTISVREKFLNCQDDGMGGIILKWPEGCQKPSMIHIDEIADKVLFDDAFWGILFGLIFYDPDFGISDGTSVGSPISKLAQCGISEQLLQSVGKNIVSGTSTLFIIATISLISQFSEAIGSIGRPFKIVSTSISEDELLRLVNDFGV